VSATTLHHGKIELALHELRSGSGRSLLLVHGLGERSPSTVPDELSAWPGPIAAIDLTGHGESTIPLGGGYHPETLMADVDSALAATGPATIVGRGLGGYLAVMIAGGRPTDVRGAIVLDGPGLAGGGPTPSSSHIPAVDLSMPGPPDPFAMLELCGDPRPPDYVMVFAQRATHLSGLLRPISICSSERPAWLEAILEAPGVSTATLEEALLHYASLE
jgi:pimeloyl-ACP methyl ester carboxylesterase